MFVSESGSESSAVAAVVPAAAWPIIVQPIEFTLTR
jgi:hypothetical protein